MSNIKRHIHLDLVGGLAGDMFLAAAIDAGLVQVAEVTEVLQKVGLGSVEIVTDNVVRGAIAGTQISFQGWDRAHEASHRHLTTIRKMLGDSGLSEAVCQRALAMFEVLGRAEAAVHGMSLEEVHFHEVGAVDSILDFVAAAYILEASEATWSVGPVPMGQGMIETAHGTIPVPAPATARVLTGMEVVARDVEAEMVTPTGATILAAMSAMSGKRQGRLAQSGFGCGTRDFKATSNVVRMTVFEAQQTPGLGGAQREDVLELICDIDDQSPEVFADVEQRLLAAGALDVSAAPTAMKKGRMGRRLSVLCEPDKEARLAAMIFEQTTTFGLRRVPLERWVLARRQESVATAFGDIAVKVGLWDGEVLKVSPEYEACAAAAKAHEVGLRRVYEAAQHAIWEHYFDGPRRRRSSIGEGKE